jgi:hypothetical protein
MSLAVDEPILNNPFEEPKEYSFHMVSRDAVTKASYDDANEMAGNGVCKIVQQIAEIIHSLSLT